MSKGNGLINGGRSGSKQTPLAAATFRHDPEVLEMQLGGLAKGAASYLKTADIDPGSISPGMNQVFKALAGKL